jgi:hypothetical protein
MQDFSTLPNCSIYSDNLSPLHKIWNAVVCFAYWGDDGTELMQSSDDSKREK